MPLVFAAITPHPPIIIAGIGKHDDLKKANSTISAMEKLSNYFEKAEVETLIVISPHLLTYPDRFNIVAMQKSYGDFAQFGAADIFLKHDNDLDLALEIDKNARAAEIETLTYNNGANSFELDHGVMVPLYFLNKNRDCPFRILPISYSHLDRSAHFNFGQIIKKTADQSSSRIGIIASGDLSHRLIEKAEAKNFDQKLTADIQNSKLEDIFYYDEEFVENAAECGYRSILILLGALNNTKVTPEVLSYEGPFGVGYLVANFKIDEKNEPIYPISS